MRAEIRKIIGFWLAQGLSGFRVDAVPFLLESSGALREMELEPHEFLRDLRAFLNRRAGGSVLLGEVTRVEAEERRLRLGDGSVVEYDYLILAAGATHSYFGNDQWEPYAPGLKTL